MKNLDHVLRSMKRISPEAGYAASSRAEILALKNAALPRVTLASVFRGAGIAAMASLAFIGGVSLVRTALPAPQVAAGPVSQQALAAEAKTVESQLALADVQHQAVADVKGSTVSPAAANVAKSAAGTSGDATVDRALDALTQ